MEGIFYKHRLAAMGALTLLVFSIFMPAQAKPFKILTLDWTSQIVLSHIIGKLLEKQGYQVEYLSQDTDSQWFLLSSEYANLQVEVWEGSMVKQFQSLVNRNLILDAGNHDALTREEWWFPAYVKKLCPGLPDWQALNDCAVLFSEDENKRGIYYTGPWEKPDRARIRALQLNYQVKTLKDSDAIRAKMEDAIALEKPILIFNWTPNWVEAVYPGEFIEFPDYEAQCETDPRWGINSELTWDCGNPRNGWLKKAVSKNVPHDWPCAFVIIKSARMNNHHIAQAAALVEVQGLDYAEAADKWITDHKPVWQSWLNMAGCRAADDNEPSGS